LFNFINKQQIETFENNIKTNILSWLSSVNGDVYIYLKVTIYSDSLILAIFPLKTIFNNFRHIFSKYKFSKSA